MTNAIKIKYFGSVSRRKQSLKIVFSKMSISQKQKQNSSCVCKEVLEKDIPNLCVYIVVLFMIFSS